MGFTRREKMVMSGDMFEVIVADNVEIACRDVIIRHNYEFYSPRLNRGTECDVIAITKNSIYCIECKHYTTFISGERFDYEWRFASSGKKSTVINPVLSNMKHIRTMQGLLRQAGYGDVEIKSLICVPDSCKIYTECKEVVNLSYLLGIVKNDFNKSKGFTNQKEMMTAIDKVKYKIRR